MHTFVLVFILCVWMEDYAARMYQLCLMQEAGFPKVYSITVSMKYHSPVKAGYPFEGADIRIFVDCLKYLGKRNMETEDIPVIRDALEAVTAPLGIGLEELALERIDYCYNAFVPDPDNRKLLMDLWHKASRTFKKAERMNPRQCKRSRTETCPAPHWCSSAVGAVKLSQLAPHMIQRFYNDLLSGGQSVPKRDKAGNIVKKNGKTVYESAPLSAKTVRNIHGVLMKALSTAVSIDYLRSNPAERVTLPRVEKAELHPLTDEQVKDFLKVSTIDDCGVILKVILFTGLRESEAIGLTWDCVDFKAGTVKICKQLQKRKLADGGMTFASLKNDRARILKPAPFVMDLLNHQWQKQVEQHLRAGKQWKGWRDQEERKKALVFTTASGSYISQTSLRYHFKKIVTEIGVPTCRVHDLRYTFAVLSLQNGDDIKTVQDSLGHATAAFTLDVYGHVSDRMKDESSARMQAYIDGIQEA